MNELLKNTMMEALDMKIEEATPTRVVMTMPVTTKTTQPAQILHGGASVALAESAASLGAFLSVKDQGMTAVGLEINANHLRPVHLSNEVRAVATPVHQGKRTQVWQIEIADDEDRKVCVSRCTLAIVPNH